MRKFIFILFLFISASTIYPMEYQTRYFSLNQKIKVHLYIAVYRNDIQRAQYLLDKKVNINCQDDNLNTPLHIAAANGHIEMVKLLLAHGAKHTVNKDQDSPWDVARDRGRAEIAFVLREHWISYMLDLL